MSRHRTIGHPKKWIEATGDIAAHWQAAYQEDIPFTAEEEAARDTEEAAAIIAQRAAASVEAERITLETKLKNDTITFEETKDLMRKERGWE
jgi:hypothetical protein